jgi:hypothetical protein
MNQINSDQINIGTESTIDLITSQNKVKIALANNLQGVGVTDADAENNTLEQLAYKVSDVISASNRQEQESIGIIPKIDGGSDSVISFVLKNGWMFAIPAQDNNNVLYYKKLSSFETFNYYEQTSTNMLTKSNMNNQMWRDNQILFTEDGNYLFVINEDSINRWTVTWGTNNSTVSFGSKITITPQYNGNSNSIYNFDINSSGDKIIFQEDDNVGIIDISNISADTNISYTPLGNISTNNECIWKFTNVDNELLCFRRNNNTNNIEITRYSVSNNSVNYEDRTIFSCNDSSRWGRGILTYKDTNNHYKIIYNNGGYNYDNFSFVIYDCTTKIFNTYYSFNVNGKNSNSKSYPINVFIRNNKYYIIAGMCVLIFDSNWNLLGNTLVKIDYDGYTHDIWNTVYFNGDLYSFSGSYYNNVVRYKLYFDKKFVYSRNVTPVGQPEKQSVYSVFPSEQDILNGYYD